MLGEHASLKLARALLFLTFVADFDNLLLSAACCVLQFRKEVVVLALLCAAAIGQIEDVAALRERYEKAQAMYNRVYQTVQESEATLKSRIAAYSKDPMRQAKYQKMLDDLRRKTETLLLRFKQSVDQLRWNYERAAGWPRNHWT